ncbi:RraA family protein [Mesorhizobium sp. CO1-1-8]|uniref:RraA family protein n=1 Tax=Mesorhizobium sp. CO1-1-8 TaxID=2876631 RepID=UPI001CD0E0AD|nr:RraA family protein [Mesorhizobium sp. CO1-1-8]MBZ9772189.1 RraA family protein [Mesorhizobium sp. CO1-1-8]
MFVLNPLPPQIEPDLIELLAQAQPATLGHFLEFGFVDPGVRALWQVPRIAGTAVTCRCSGLDGTIIRYALGQIRAGDVLVIDRVGDHRAALIGGSVAFAARKLGVAGIIIDGTATDISEIRDYQMPIWGRGLSSLTTKRLLQNGEFCVPVVCGGISISPGDAILADENGIVVLGPSQVRDSAERAIAMQELEVPLLEALAKGIRLPDFEGTSGLMREIVATQSTANRP